jgi:cytochrome c oxidase subunit IV
MSATARLVAVWAALMLLLAITVAATFLPLGDLRILVSYGVAIAKAALVLWYFMELSNDDGLARLAALAAFAWTSILFILVCADYLTRGWSGAGALLL